MKQPRNRVHDRRLAFAREYVVDLQVGPAMIRAGYSARSASAQGTKLLKDPVVQAEIQRLTAGKIARAEVSADQVLAGLGAVAFSDIRRYFRPDGSLIPVHELSDEAAAALSSVDVKEIVGDDGQVAARLVRLKLWDKNKALSDLARHFKLLTEVVQISGDITLLEKVQRARARGALLRQEREALLAVAIPAAIRTSRGGLEIPN